MYQRGPEHAKEAAQRVADSLFPLQEGDGSWKGGQGEEQGAGKIYRTSMALLSLAVKYHYLPIYQR